MSPALCPCDSGLGFDRCCGPILDGLAPVTAEALMRSRYTAYTRADSSFLLNTWHPDHRPDTVSFVDGQKWLGLKIRHTSGGCEDDRSGVVEFVARFKVAGRGHRLHESSRFVKIDGNWLYVDGELIER